MDRTLILNELQKLKKFSKLSDFANFLGIDLKKLYAWRAKNRYNIGILEEKFPEVSRHWLMTGEGKMLKSEDSGTFDYIIDHTPIKEVDRGRQLEDLTDYYGDKSMARLARLLHVQPQTIVGWKKRNTIDIERCFHYLPNVSASWLITGEGDMIIKEDKKPEPESATPTAIEAMSRIIADQASEIAFLKMQLEDSHCRLRLASEPNPLRRSK